MKWFEIKKGYGEYDGAPTKMYSKELRIKEKHLGKYF